VRLGDDRHLVPDEMSITTAGTSTVTAETAGTPAAVPVLIDALNVAYWCDRPPSLRLPIALLVALLKSGRRTWLYFDASARHQLSAEAALYERLMLHEAYCIEVRSGIPADRVLLRQAKALGACVLSRDRYRDHRRRHRKFIDDPSRLLSGAVARDRVLVPGLALDAPLPATADAAWAELEALLHLPAERAAIR
jgi:hypothetical protein